MGLFANSCRPAKNDPVGRVQDLVLSIPHPPKKKLSSTYPKRLPIKTLVLMCWSRDRFHEHESTKTDLPMCWSRDRFPPPFHWCEEKYSQIFSEEPWIFFLVSVFWLPIDPGHLCVVVGCSHPPKNVHPQVSPDPNPGGSPRPGCHQDSHRVRNGGILVDRLLRNIRNTWLVQKKGTFHDFLYYHCEYEYVSSSIWD